MISRAERIFWTVLAGFFAVLVILGVINARLTPPSETPDQRLDRLAVAALDHQERAGEAINELAACGRPLYARLITRLTQTSADTPAQDLDGYLQLLARYPHRNEHRDALEVLLRAPNATVRDKVGAILNLPAPTTLPTQPSQPAGADIP